MNAKDRIVTMIAIGELGGMQAVEPNAFVALFPDSWQELLRAGLSFYIDALGQALAPEEALRRLQPQPIWLAVAA